MMPTTKDLQHVFRWLRSNEAYEWLPFDSWLSGGCWVLAEALHRVLPMSEVWWVTDEQGMPHHAVVEHQGRFLDGDGQHTEDELLRYWEQEENIVDAHLTIQDDRRKLLNIGLDCPVEFVGELERRLRRLLDGPERKRRGAVYHTADRRYEDVGWTPTGRWGNQGSGILFTTGEKILLLRRSSSVEEPGTWGIPGGAVPQTTKGTFRDPYVSAKQETREELGTLPTHQIVDQYVYEEAKFRYTTYVAKVSAATARRFRPTLNWENDDYGWFTREEIQDLDLHFGVVELLHHVDPFFI